MQALIVGGGTEEDVIFDTSYIPTPKDLVTITPPFTGITSTFNIIGAPILTVELWGGGGASGSARDGISGAGGAGGYVKALVNVTDIPGVRIQVGGGGGAGIPEYYAIPSDEYLTENIANIISVGTSSVNSQITLTSPFEVGAARSTTAATEGSNPAVSYVSSSSGSSVIQLPTTSLAGDIILLASSCDEGNILLATGFSAISNGTGNPSYRLSYKYVATANETISGLEPTINGRPVSHVAQVFRGVNPIATEGVISQGLQTNPGLPTLPDATSELSGCMLASFGFFDNVGLLPTAITAPTGHLNLISASSNSVLPITPVTTLTGNTFVAVNAADTSFTVSGLQAGDFVIVVAGSDGQTPANPTGWTSLPGSAGGAGPGGNNPGRRVSYTFATGTSITLDGLSNPENNPGNDPPILNRNIAYAVLAFRNVDPDSPINGSANDIGGPNGNPEAPVVTTTIDGCMIVALGVLDNDSMASTVVAPTGYTLGPVAATGTDGGTQDSATVMSAYLPQTTAGTTNLAQFTNTNADASDNWSAHTLALSPLIIDSTVMAASRALPTATDYTNGSFGITGASEPSVGTSILLVRNNNFVPSSSTMSITGSLVGDIIIVASVNDNLTPSLPALPSGSFANISNGTGYRLSWKRVESVDINAVTGQVTVSGLTSLGQDNNNNSALIRHVAYVYRGAVDLRFSAALNGTGNSINTPNISAPADETLSQYACIPFGFIRNVSLTTGITASDPNYTLGTIYPVGTDSTGISEATLVNAFRNGLPDATPETPTDFTITSSVNWSSVTVALSPSATSSTFSGSINLPVGTQVGDLVLVASVADGGTLGTARSGASGPFYQSLYNETNQTPSYRLSYKFIESATETTVDNLSVSTLNIGGDGPPTPRGTAHTVQVFRGVNPLLPILSSGPDNGTNNQPDSPLIGVVSPNNTVVSFAFIDDRSVSVTGTPAGYTLGPVASVGTNPNSNSEATIISAYNSTPTSPNEDPGNFTISNADDWDAVTILLQNNVTQKFYNFPLNPGGCGGSSGGYTALYAVGGLRDGQLILMVGGGGGGGGSAIIPSGSTIFTPQYEASRSVGGSGGVGGGNGGNGLPGSNGLSFLATGGAFSIAGQGGNGGTTVSGGIGGNSFRNTTVIPVLNPGETGVEYTNITSGGRGANFPYNTSDIPLQGANATGGYMAGRGGGSSRTDSTLVDAAIPSDCGGAGGPGYYGGGGGGPGLYGGGGGGGGGSSYYDPTVVTIISSEVGIGTNPAGRGSEFWSFPIAVGGTPAIGNLTAGVPATTTSIGSTGGDGRAVVTFFTV
jgi:hypothetical protein